MKEKIKFKNGELQIFDIDKTIEILKIGYTLTEDETSYDKAIIVRDGKNNNIITNSQEVIMRFLNLYAKQNDMTLDQIFNEPYILRLYGEDERALNELAEKKEYINELRAEKRFHITAMITSAIVSLLATGTVCLNDYKDLRFITSVIMLASSILTGKHYANAKNISFVELEDELEDMLQEYGEDLPRENVYARLNSGSRGRH